MTKTWVSSNSLFHPLHNHLDIVLKLCAKHILNLSPFFIFSNIALIEIIIISPINYWWILLTPYCHSCLNFYKPILLTKEWSIDLIRLCLSPGLVNNESLPPQLQKQNDSFQMIFKIFRISLETNLAILLKAIKMSVTSKTESKSS